MQTDGTLRPGAAASRFAAPGPGEWVPSVPVAPLANKIIATNPINLFVEMDLHAFIENDGTKNVELENYYSKIEGTANTTIEKSLRQRDQKSSQT